jgi:hypothetical protein
MRSNMAKICATTFRRYVQQHAEDMRSNMPKISILFTPLSLRLKCKVFCTDSSLVNVAEDAIGHPEIASLFD